MMKKYELTDKTLVIDTPTIEGGISRTILHRIRALKDFSSIKNGDLGGWVETEDNLSQEDNCWISDNARISDDAVIFGNARVSNDVVIRDKAMISGYTRLSGNLIVFGDTQLTGSVWIYGKYVGSKDVLLKMGFSNNPGDHFAGACNSLRLKKWLGIAGEEITEEWSTPEDLIDEED